MTEEAIYFGVLMFSIGAIVGALVKAAISDQDSEYTEYLKMRVRRYEKDEMKIVERWEDYKKAHYTSEKEDSNQKGE